MNDVADHWRFLVKPTFRERVFAVVYIAFVLIVATIVVEVVVGCAGVHIPHLAVVATVGLLISRNKSVIRCNFRVSDNL